MVLGFGLAVFLNLMTISQVPSSGQKYYDHKSSPPRAELGQINLEKAVALSRRLIEKVYSNKNASARAFELELHPERAYGIHPYTKNLEIEFMSSIIVFNPIDGQIRLGTFRGIYSLEPKLTLEDAKKSAGDYFQIFEPNSTYLAKFERMSGIHFEIMVYRTIGGIPFDRGLRCLIDSKEGRLITFNYLSSYPLHGSSKVNVTEEKARESAAEALARFRPHSWIEFLPEHTQLFYSIPPIENDFVEMDKDQVSIGLKGEAIPQYKFEAHQTANLNKALRTVEGYSVYVDARNGRTISIDPLLPPSVGLDTLNVKTPRPKMWRGLRVLAGGKWVDVPNGSMSIVNGSEPSRVGRHISIVNKNSVWNAHYDSKSGLIWDTSGDGWVGQANPELRRFLENVKPVFPRFGKQNKK